MRALLDEQDDADQHGDLGEHRAGPRLEELVDDAEPERRDDGTRKLADAAEHDDHERVDDIALPEVGSDIADLRQCASGETGESRAESEGKHVDARGAHADALAIAGSGSPIAR